MFCPLLADPKSDRSFLGYFRGSSTSAFGTDLGAFGVGDQLGLFRWNGPVVGEGIQLSLGGGVHAQLDLNSESFDLINADYVLSLPLTFRRGRLSSRLRVYHQSSHLGDEFVLRTRVQRENFSFEAGELIVAVEAGPLRAYGGGEYLFHRMPSLLERNVVHGGAELRQPNPLFPTRSTNQVRLVAALDVKLTEELDWSLAWSARAGFEVGRTPGKEHLSRPWSLLAEYYTGPSPYGQFFQDEVTYYGVGLHLGP